MMAERAVGKQRFSSFREFGEALGIEVPSVPDPRETKNLLVSSQADLIRELAALRALPKKTNREMERYQTEKGRVIGQVLSLPADARKDISAVAIAPVTKSGRIARDGSEFFDYPIFAVSGSRGNYRVFSSFRQMVTLPGGALSNATAAVDSLVHKNARILPEQIEDTYERDIAAIRHVDSRLQPLEEEHAFGRDYLYPKLAAEMDKLESQKMSFVLSYFEHADLLAQAVSAPMYEFSPGYDRSLIQLNMRITNSSVPSGYLLGKTQAKSPSLSDKYWRTNLRLPNLYAAEREFDRGFENESTGAAVAILDKLRSLQVVRKK